jgi:AAA domain
VIEISNETTSAEIADYALGCMLDAYCEREAMQIYKLGASGKITASEAREKLDKILSELSITGAQTNWLATIDRATVTSSELACLPLNERRPLLGDWLCEGDYGIIFAPRGVGKTWLGLLIAEAVATGGHVGEWKALAPGALHRRRNASRSHTRSRQRFGQWRGRISESCNPVRSYGEGPEHH